MMRKIVDDGDAIDLGFDFQTAFDTLESLQSRGNLRYANTVVRSHRSRSCRVQDVVLTGQCKFKIRPLSARAKHLPRGRRRTDAYICDPPGRGLLHPVTLDWAKCLRQTAIQTHSGIMRDDLAAPGNQIYQTLERRFHSLQIVVDVR